MLLLRKLEIRLETSRPPSLAPSSQVATVPLASYIVALFMTCMSMDAREEKALRGGRKLKLEKRGKAIIAGKKRMTGYAELRSLWSERMRAERLHGSQQQVSLALVNSMDRRCSWNDRSETVLVPIDVVAIEVYRYGCS